MFHWADLRDQSPHISVACCVGPDPTSRSCNSLLQCYGRILSEHLTCPVDWTLPGQNIKTQNIERKLSKDKTSKSQNIEYAKYQIGKILNRQNIK